MRTTTRHIILLLISPILIGSCSLFNYDRIDFPAISTEYPIPINATTMKVTGVIEGVTTGEIETYGHYWSLTETAPDVNEVINCTSCTQFGPRRVSGVFESLIEGLNINDEYFVWAYMIHKDHGLILSEPLYFYTGTINVETLERADLGLTDLELFGLISNVDVLSGSGQQVSAFGHVWDTVPHPDLHSNLDFSISGPTVDNQVFSTLVPNNFFRNTFYYRAYAIVDNVDIYGEERLLCLSGWEDQGDFAQRARSNATGFVLNDKLYIGTGIYRSGTAHLSDFASLDPSVGTWDNTTVPALPAGNARSSATSFVLNGRVYLGTGENNNQKFGDFWVWEEGAPEWTLHPEAFPGPARSEALTFVLGSYAYLFGGEDNNGNTLNDLWLFDGEQWISMSPPDAPGRSDAFLFVVDDVAYLGGGIRDGSFLSDFWRFDGNSWQQLADLPDGNRTGAVAFSIGQNGYVASGKKQSTGVTSDIYIYNTDLGTWEVGAPMPEALAFREDAVAMVLDGYAYFGTGRSLLNDRGYLLDTWNFFDPCNTP